MAKPNFDHKADFSENIDYSSTGDKSIWGEGDPDTLKALKKHHFSGTWLNLAAGDGRYNNILLTKADKVIATDIDPKALQKLYQTTPQTLKSKLETKQQDLLEPFPFPPNSFDGVFSMGTLHLFSPEQLEFIFSEITKVLKTSGQIIIDFATDIKRVLPDQTLLVFPKETSYSHEQALKLLKTNLQNYTYQIIESSVSPEKVEFEKTSFMFSCRFMIIIGTKNI